MKLEASLLVTFLLVGYCNSDRCDTWDWIKKIKPVLFTRKLSTCNGMATNAHFPDAARQQIVDLHNGVRAAAANGCAKTTNGTLPMSCNMRVMTYNCSLEKSAQAWADTCPSNHSMPSGENIFKMYGNTRRSTDPFKTAIKSFNNNELPKIGDRMLNNTKFVGNIRDITHYTAMIWAKTSSVGCGLNVCYKDPTIKYARGYIIVCHYYPIGNVIGFYTYEKGEPCKVDSDCIDDGFNKCVTNLGMCSNGKPGLKFV